MAHPDRDGGSLDAALALAGRGWYVFPVTERGKTPTVRWRDWSTTAVDVIAAEWSGRSLNVGIDCGKSGLLVVDEDEPGGFARFTESIGQTAPATYTVATAKGSHFYFAADGSSHGNTAGPLAQFGCDVRGDGGYVLAAGSTHPSGAVYHVASDCSVAPLPGWLADALDGNGGPFTDPAQRFELPDVIKAGERDQVLFQYACQLRAQGTKVAAAARLVRAAHGRCEQPAGDRFTVAQALAKIDQAWGYDTGTTSTEAASPGATRDPFADAVTFAELDEKTFPAPTYLVDKILPRGGITLLAGAPKNGKSYLALGAALAVAQNGTALGRLAVTEPGGVLFISLDDQNKARAQQRARQINKGQPLPRPATLHVEPNLGRGEQARDAIGTYLNRHPDTQLVVIDTLTHLRADRASTEGTYDADVRFMATLRTLLDGVRYTILCLAHVRKERADDGVMAISGTYGVTGGADSLIILTGNRHAPGRAIEVVSRDDEGCELALTFTEHGLFVTDDDPHDPALFLVPDDARVYRALKEFDEGGATAAEITGALGATGGTRTGDRLARLAKHSVIRRVGRGHYVAD